MTGMSSLFSTYQVCSGRDKVRIADGSYSSITGKGDIHATPFMPLSSVFHVPNFSLNLLSISHITKSINYNVTFFSSHCVFQDLEMRMSDRGFERDGLYLLKTSSLVASPVYQVSTLMRSSNKSSSEDLVH